MGRPAEIAVDLWRHIRTITTVAVFVAVVGVVLCGRDPPEPANSIIAAAIIVAASTATWGTLLVIACAVVDCWKGARL